MKLKNQILLILCYGTALSLGEDSDGDGYDDQNDSHPFNPNAWYEGQVIWFGSPPPPHINSTSNKGFKSLSTSASEGCGITLNDEYLFWGVDEAELQNLQPNINRPSSLRAGQRSFCAIGEDGTVQKWGVPSFSSVAESPDQITSCVDIALASYTGIALLADNSILSWGNSGVNLNSLGSIPSALSNSGKAISAYNKSHAVIGMDNRLYVWGQNVQLTTGVINSPNKASLGLMHVVVLKSDGKAEGWTVTRNNVTQDDQVLAEAAIIGLEEEERLVDVATGNQFTVALSSSGYVSFFGNPNVSGNPDAMDIRPPENLRNVKGIVAGGDHWAAVIGGRDKDGDNLEDSFEISEYGSDPTLIDTDGDGLDDGDEIYIHQTSPSEADSDGDGFTDFFELSVGSDPRDVESVPAAALVEVRPAVELSIYTQLGKRYRLEYSDDLENWQTDGVIIEGKGARVDYFQSTREKTRKYWRAIELNN